MVRLLPTYLIEKAPVCWGNRLGKVVVWFAIKATSNLTLEFDRLYLQWPGSSFDIPLHHNHKHESTIHYVTINSFPSSSILSFFNTITRAPYSPHISFPGWFSRCLWVCSSDFFLETLVIKPRGIRSPKRRSEHQGRNQRGWKWRSDWQTIGMQMYYPRITSSPVGPWYRWHWIRATTAAYSDCPININIVK